MQKETQELIEAIESTEFTLREGIINNGANVHEPTFRHLFGFHCAVLKMFMQREKALESELKELKDRLSNIGGL